MELKALMKVGLLLFLMGFTATTVDASFDPSSFISEVLPNGDGNYYMKSTTTACCDRCVCTRSIPPKCQCKDVGESCHSACKSCLCTRSIPPICRCMDTTYFCYVKCDSSQAMTHLE
ncbi:Bowman-Birk type proteinase inhibitor [Cajanus cajan]|uniref:Bowman-Birk type proteinase inhibitor n=1 Tax=Cajanus cajan TaxID=3821 RepID=A0A151TBJ9_CAJCA|nr:Bowman-Birk type proteinase inhibitor [Cajanus cajan]KYP64429.1 Bowman-Birk type proteinase inhibitor [Cajanus cajan]